MSTKALFVLGLVFIIVAGFFYASNDASLMHLNLKPSDIDYQAKQIQALQTDGQGEISYQLHANEVTHYQNAKIAVLSMPKILWRPKPEREVSLMADSAKFDEAQQVVMLDGKVSLISKPLVANALLSKQPIQLIGQDIVGDLTHKRLTSTHPVTITQGNHQFIAQDLSADMAMGNYTFNQVEMRFTPSR